MRRLAALLFLLTIAASARAEDWTTADGKTYHNVVVIAQQQDGVRITYTGGVGIIPYYELSDDLLKRFGQDPASLAVKRAAAEKAAADAALKAQQDAAEQKAEQDAAAAAAAQNASSSQSTPSSQPNSQQQSSAAAPKPVTPAPVTPQHPASGSATASGPGQENTTEPASGPAFMPTQAIPTPDNPYPHSKFHYEENADMSYLDSFPVPVVPIVLDAPTASAPAPSDDASLFLRIETEGHRAEAPDTITGTFVSPIPLKKLSTDNKVRFLVDGSYVAAAPPQTDGDEPADPSLVQVVFVLTPEQMRSIILGKKLNLSVGNYDYRIDDNGIAVLRGYLDDVDHLPPASTNIVRSYHRFLNRLPSIITMISTTCEYIILGAFAVVVLASIAAFVMGLTRFIKM